MVERPSAAPSPQARVRRARSCAAWHCVPQCPCHTLTLAPEPGPSRRAESAVRAREWSPLLLVFIIGWVLGWVQELRMPFSTRREHIGPTQVTRRYPVIMTRLVFGAAIVWR